ncbi:MAG: HD domain-containing protein [Candidatus Omnitrophica bacterium]|nr:HD domain-containing protein [Candidatus Omnitrophota bacterium]
MTQAASILVIDPDSAVRAEFPRLFAQESYEIFTVATWGEAEPLLKRQAFQIIIAAICLPDISCRVMVQRIREENRSAFVITAADFSGIEQAMESLHFGAQDYISKPFDPRDTLVAMRKFVEKQRAMVETLQLLDTIKAFAYALEARDPYTHGHSQEVADYATALANFLGFSRRDIENVRDAAILHDVGKIGIPDAVLLKPAPLTDDEMCLIKQHPQIGKKILAPVSMLAEKIPLIYHHHERFDGRGYPVGLRGDDIPPGARLIAVADTFQAMTSSRPYRAALTKEAALAELARCRGTQFAPELVDSFLKMVG